MAKKSDINYLVGLNRQLQHAINEGLEESYAFGELIVQVLDLVDGWPPIDDGEATLGPDSDDMESDVTESRLPSQSGPGGSTPRSGDPIPSTSGLGSQLASLPREELERVLRGALGQSVRGLKVPVPKAKRDGDA